MNCAEFQKMLPEIFEQNAEFDGHEHLRTCKDCASLVADLRYIADQAKLLLPMHDPSPRVWQNIEATLRKDPAAPEGRRPGLPKKKRSEIARWKVVGMAALLSALTLGAIAYNSARTRPPQKAAVPVAGASATVN